MSREILFKAKRVDNGKWICWNLYGELCRLSGKRTSLAIKNGATTHYYDYIYQVRQLIDAKTICRYTGLTDKNGNKLWENDVTKNYLGITQIVTFESGSFQFIEPVDFVYNERQGDDFCSCKKKYLDYKKGVLADEVIGNIFDNPEFINY